MRTFLKTFSMLVAIISFCASCTNDIVSDETKSSNFDKELSSYVATQRAILNKRKAITRAEGHLTFEELVAMACEIDSTSRAFYEAHPELTAQISGEITLEDIEIMKLDTDSLQAFVDRNFSKDISKIVDANINDKEIKDNNVLLPRFGDSEVDKTLKANLNVSQEFNDMVTNNIQPPTPLKATQSYCKGQYNNRIGGCKTSYYRTIALTTICAALFSPITGAGAAAAASLSYSLAIYDYQNCLDDAYKSYADCLR